jgi:hypothetical protein
MISRRGFLKFLLAAGVAEAAMDVERLLWVPRPIITVPAMPVLSTGEMIAQAWEAYVIEDARDSSFQKYWFLQNTMREAKQLKTGVWLLPVEYGRNDEA